MSVYNYPPSFPVQTWASMVDQPYPATERGLMYSMSCGPKILSLVFRENSFPFQVYSPLQLAVKMGSATIVKQLLEWGAGVINGQEHIVDFYIRHLQENVAPTLEVLQLLLEKTTPEQGFVEKALKQMNTFTLPHWEVIECLIARDWLSFDREMSSFTFKVLKKKGISLSEVYHRFKWEPALPIRSLQIAFSESLWSEVAFLDSLTRFIALERKYYPQSKSSLSFQEFLRLTGCVRMVVFDSLTANYGEVLIEDFFGEKAVVDFTKFQGKHFREINETFTLYQGIDAKLMEKISSVFLKTYVADGFLSLLHNLVNKEIKSADRDDFILGFKKYFKNLIEKIKENEGPTPYLSSLITLLQKIDLYPENPRPLYMAAIW